MHPLTGLTGPLLLPLYLTATWPEVPGPTAEPIGPLPRAARLVAGNDASGDASKVPGRGTRKNSGNFNGNGNFGNANGNGNSGSFNGNRNSGNGNGNGFASDGNGNGPDR